MICLRDYQEEIMQHIRKEWCTHRSIMVQMPTGTGKTYVLAASLTLIPVSSGEKEKTGLHGPCDDRPVWIVAHRRELVAQIEETIGRYGIDREGGQVKVMSIQWLARHWEDAGKMPRLIVIDEAHHALARTYRMLWERCPQTKFLGLTATPCRMDRSGFTDLFDSLVCSESTAEFIQKGVLSAFDYVSIRANSQEQRMIDSLAKRGADGDYQTKEMDYLLNRHASIERLYRSIECFACGKKGIVYAISIDHARKIAAYYDRMGMKSAPIDSHTPATERKRLVEEFKAGKIQVLVNVDIFSEGFDCPDVEFVQMARPTLSLSKYLQQVGRGLRKTKDKESCVLIDNVGLYRVFGLPTVVRDWEAMFRGNASGKGKPIAQEAGTFCLQSEQPLEEAVQECDMEVIVSHEHLLSEMEIWKENRFTPKTDIYGLKAWQDDGNRLWGLRRGKEHTTDARFVSVFDIRYEMAAVRLGDRECGVVSDIGEIIWKKEGCQSLKFLKDRFLHVTIYNKVYYMDLYNLRMYGKKPEVKRYGTIELLKINHVYYSRTKKVYVNDRGIDGSFISHKKFYLSIYDNRTAPPGGDKGGLTSRREYGFACLLEGDGDSYYWLYRRLADGSIIVRAPQGRYYHAESGKEKQYVGCTDTEKEETRCRIEVERLAAEAERKALANKSEKEEKLLHSLKRDGAVPFKSGLKWGLKLGGRIVVPPIYRNVRPPVGKYCAVEKNYSQWGVVSIDGTWVVEPQYSDIEINVQGTVTGTKVTGNKVSIRLP